MALFEFFPSSGSKVLGPWKLRRLTSRLYKVEREGGGQRNTVSSWVPYLPTNLPIEQQLSNNLKDKSKTQRVYVWHQRNNELKMIYFRFIQVAERTLPASSTFMHSRVVPSIQLRGCFTIYLCPARTGGSKGGDLLFYEGLLQWPPTHGAKEIPLDAMGACKFRGNADRWAIAWSLAMVGFRFSC